MCTEYLSPYEWAVAEFAKLLQKHPKFLKLCQFAQKHMDLQNELNEHYQVQHLIALNVERNKNCTYVEPDFSDEQLKQIEDDAARALDHQRDNWTRVDEDQWANEQSWEQLERLNINQINDGWQ